MSSEHAHIWSVLGYKDGMVEWRCDGCSAHGFMQDHLIIYEFLRIAPLYQAAEQQLQEARALLEQWETFGRRIPNYVAALPGGTKLTNETRAFLFLEKQPAE